MSVGHRDKAGHQARAAREGRAVPFLHELRRKVPPIDKPRSYPKERQNVCPPPSDAGSCLYLFRGGFAANVAQPEPSLVPACEGHEAFDGL